MPMSFRLSDALVERYFGGVGKFLEKAKQKSMPVGDSDKTLTVSQIEKNMVATPLATDSHVVLFVATTSKA
jgi:hypothetical protein